MKLNTLVAAGLAGVAVLTAGCGPELGGSGGGSSSPSVSSGTSGSTSGGTSDGTSRGVSNGGSAQQAAFPSRLVGTWQTDDQWLTFAADGRFSSRGARSGTLTGVAEIDGAQLTLRYDDIAPQRSSWSLSGNLLFIDGISYLRVDPAPGSSGAASDAAASTVSLVGLWIDANSGRNLRFDADGSYRVDHPSGAVTTGMYRTDGTRLLLQGSSDSAPRLYDLSFDGTFLRVSGSNGQLLGEFVRAG